MAKKAETSKNKPLIALRERAAGELSKLEKELAGLEKKAKRTGVYARAKRLRKGFEKRAEQVHSQVIDALGLASRNDLDKLNKKINAVSRKVNKSAQAA